MAQRFLQLAEVSEVLNISSAQAYALVRSGELPAIKIGGRGQWRVEATELESYIQRMYAETKSFVEAHPFGGTGRGVRSARSGQLPRRDRVSAQAAHRPERRERHEQPAGDVGRAPRLVGRVLGELEVVGPDRRRWCRSPRCRRRRRPPPPPGPG